jgi:hypothetical protein
MSACVGQVTPAPESCNGLDDDCDGIVDNGLVQTCYDGPAYSIDANGNPKGVCKAGTQVCQNGAWGVCQGEVLPQPEVCSPDPGNVTTALDLDCDGTLISCGCTDGNTRPCFSGPGTPGVGICKTGMQTCTGREDDEVRGVQRNADRGLLRELGGERSDADPEHCREGPVQPGHPDVPGWQLGSVHGVRAPERDRVLRQPRQQLQRPRGRERGVPVGLDLSRRCMRPGRVRHRTAAARGLHLRGERDGPAGHLREHGRTVQPG